jgi:hypothetical protein
LGNVSLGYFCGVYKCKKQKKKNISDFLTNLQTTYSLDKKAGGTIVILKSHLYGSKPAPKLWYKGYYQLIIEL